MQKLGRSCRRVVERVSHTALGGVLDWGRRREGRRGRNIVVRLVVGGAITHHIIIRVSVPSTLVVRASDTAIHLHQRDGTEYHVTAATAPIKINSPISKKKPKSQIKEKP